MFGSVLRALAYITLALLALFSLGSWILAAVDLRRVLVVNNGYDRISPAFLVASIFGFFFYLFLIAGGRSRFINAFVALLGTLVFFFWFLGCAIAYSVRAWDGPFNCGRNRFGLRVSCYTRYLSLMAFSWTVTGLTLIYMILVTLLASRHSKREGASGWHGVGVNKLCTYDPRAASYGPSSAAATTPPSMSGAGVPDARGVQTQKQEREFEQPRPEMAAVPAVPLQQPYGQSVPPVV